MSIKSRYDFMSEGTVKDEKTNSLYPDPLTLNYADFKLTSMPNKVKLSSEDIIFFWNTVGNFYGSCYFDDMVLSLNGVEHKNLLKNEDIIYIPSESDIDSSFKK